MRRLRTIIVDDEPLARERLRNLIATEPDTDLVAEFADGAQALDGIRALAPDLLLLDVQMPVLDGFGMLSRLDAALLPAVVFITAHHQYALRAFEVYAQDYLLKPVDADRFRQAIRRVRQRLLAPRPPSPETLREFLGFIRSGAAHPQRIAIRQGDRHVLVDAGDVAWIEADGQYVRVHAGRNAYLVREVLGRFAARLDPERFVRVHRSYVVNRDHIASVEPWTAQDYLLCLRDGTRLQSSRGYKDAVWSLLGRT